jgi:hypothetical protein
MSGIFAHPDFIRDDAARIAFRRQELGVIEAMLGAGCRARRIAVPADLLLTGELIDLALERQAECRPAEHGALGKLRPSTIRTSVAFGYHSGHSVASTMRCQTRPHGAPISKNKSALAGSNPGRARESRARDAPDPLAWS